MSAELQAKEESVSSDDTFSDGIDDQQSTDKNQSPQQAEATILNDQNKDTSAAPQTVPDDDDESDEFDFSEQPKRLKLKPSNIQKQTEQKLSSHIKQNSNHQQELEIEPDDEDEEEDKLAMQTDVLSNYLKPTSILSKYQNGPQSQQQPAEQLEEEEKEWPTEKEELAFNNATEVMQQQSSYINNQEEEEEEEEEPEEKSSFDPIEFDDLYLYLRGQASTKVKDSDIVVEDLRNVSWFQLVKLFFAGGCSIALKSAELLEERDDVFKLAKLKLDSTDIAHHRCLISLWMKITDDTRACDKTGSHWQQIGFQGNDPATDIRGAGLLGLLQLVYLVEHHEELINKIYVLSLNDHQNFPLVIVSFSITGIVMQLLRSCMIYHYINSKKSVMLAINEIYIALFYEFYLNWKNKSRTIINFDEAQKELEKEAFVNWEGLIEQVKRRENEVIEQLNRDKQKKEDLKHVEFGNAERTKSKAANASVDRKRQNQYQAA